MENNSTLNRQDNKLFCLLGEAVFLIQELESGLSFSLTLKGHKPISKYEGDKRLNHYRRYTLGRAINKSKEKNIYSDLIMINLEQFIEERNWLIHSCVFDITSNSNENYCDPIVISRINQIIIQCRKLNNLILSDLIAFAEKNGKNMSRVRMFVERGF